MHCLKLLIAVLVGCLVDLCRLGGTYTCNRGVAVYCANGLLIIFGGLTFVVAFFSPQNELIKYHMYKLVSIEVLF